jgi:hypothetical protein
MSDCAFTTAQKLKTKTINNEILFCIALPKLFFSRKDAKAQRNLKALTSSLRLCAFAGDFLLL